MSMLVLSDGSDGSDGGPVREIDVVEPPLVPFLYPSEALEATPRRPLQCRPRLPHDCWPAIAERAQYESLRDLAAEYGVSHETIRTIVRGARGAATAPMAAD